jgi:S1-C subfamily serine protease
MSSPSELPVRFAHLRRILLLATIVGIPNLTAAQNTPPPVVLGPGDIYKLSSSAVVLIETFGADGKLYATGSGFLVSADGRILTNFHVIAHSRSATVSQPFV